MKEKAAEWKDDSDGRGSEANFGGFRLAVHRHIHYKPTDWLMSVFGLGIETVLLVNTKDRPMTMAEAKKEARRWLIEFLTTAVRRVGRLKES